MSCTFSCSVRMWMHCDKFNHYLAESGSPTARSQLGHRRLYSRPHLFRVIFAFIIEYVIVTVYGRVAFLCDGGAVERLKLSATFAMLC